MIKLSIKNLAAFALDDFCPRCLWTKHQLGYKYPYSMFPGVFAVIDSHAKKFCDKYLEENDLLAPWFESRFSGYTPMKAPHWSKMNLTLGGIETRGATDYILKKGDNIVVIDNKTSKFKDETDKFAKLYDFQLNACGMALEANGHGKVQSLELDYYVPQDVNESALLYTSLGPALEFEVKVREVPIDTDMVNEVAAKAEKILSQEKMPDSAEGCKDCDLVSKLVEVYS